MSYPQEHHPIGKVGGEIAEDDGESDAGQPKFAISLDVGDEENSAVEGVELSATAGCSQLGSEEKEL